MKAKMTEKCQKIFKIFEKKESKKENKDKKLKNKDKNLNIEENKVDNTEIEVLDKERKTKKKHIIKGKLGIELLSISIVPILIVGTLTCVITWKSFTSNTTDQIEKDLYTAAIAIVSSFEQNVGEYTYATNADGSQGDFWKGGCNISKSSALLEQIKEKADIDITIANKERIVITTAVDEKTGENKNIEISNNIFEKVFEKGYEDFNGSMKIDGVNQFMYVVPMVQIDKSEVMAMIIVSSNKDVSMESTYDVLKIVLIILLVIIIAIIIYVSIFTRGITNSLKAGFNALELLSRGDLRIKAESLKINRKDEIGEMSRSIYTLSEEFRKIISSNIDMTKDIEDTANELNNTAKNTRKSVDIVDSAMENMSEAANTQAKIVVDVNKDMAVLGSMIKNTYSEIKSINEYNTEMLNSSRIANKIISELTYIRESLNSIIDVINKQTEDTYGLTKDIRKYAEMIVSFADETNLLALNATIEAARVGEEGKGFAIVAAQIQGLADQSTVVSNDISKTVNLLVNDSKKSLDTMEQVNSVIEKLNSNIDDTKEIFNIVNEGIGFSADGLIKIQEQTAGIDKSRGSMMKVMAELQQVSEKNIKCATDTEEVTKHIGQLFDEIGNIKHMTEKLVESVEVFEV